MIGVYVHGRDIYEQLRMPVVPRRGDRLWLSSLCSSNRVPREVIVTKVEWARDQTARFTDRENEGIHARITVRRVSDPEAGGES